MKITEELNYIAKNKRILKRATYIALIVGTVLALINHYETIFSGRVSLRELLQILLTYAVPFCVSLISAILQKRDRADRE